MTPQVAWYAARAAGVVAWLLLTASVLWGLLLAVRLGRRPAARWLLDLHRFLGGLAVVFTAIHVVALLADTTVHFDIVDLVVPGASAWRPLPVALGVVGMWILAAVELTSLLMRHLPRRTWRIVHLTSYVLFWIATVHALTAGTDAGSVPFVVTVDAAVTLVVFLSLVRGLSPRAGLGTTVRPTTA